MIEDVVIKPNAEKYQLKFDPFVAVGTESCEPDYIWTYKASYDAEFIDNSSVPQYAIFNAIDRLFTFQTSLGGQSYNIVLKGILSDNQSTAEVSFRLTVTDS